MVGLVVAFAIGLGIFVGAVYMVRLLATPLPPEPDPEEVLEVAVDYRCTVCGMRLTITHAQDEDVAAPKHCREEMVTPASG